VYVRREGVQPTCLACGLWLAAAHWQGAMCCIMLQARHCSLGWHRLLILPLRLQVAAKAQKASVTASEVVRYEEYNARHGARYAQAGAGQDALEDEEPW
jgi:hypothetical protein